MLPQNLDQPLLLRHERVDPRRLPVEERSNGLLFVPIGKREAVVAQLGRGEVWDGVLVALGREDAADGLLDVRRKPLVGPEKDDQANDREDDLPQTQMAAAFAALKEQLASETPPEETKA